MSEDTKNALKITGQFRTKNTMVYDFRGSGNRLTLRVTQRELATDSGEWRVDASMGRPPEPVLTGWGSTRTEALKAVAQSWLDTGRSLGLPPFDWEAVQVALVAVRAL